jgi:hypothetical protein
MNSGLGLVMILAIIAAIGAGREMAWPDAMLRVTIVLVCVTMGYLILAPLFDALINSVR